VGEDVSNGSCYHRLPSPYSLTIASSSSGDLAGSLNGLSFIDDEQPTVRYRVWCIQIDR
jgi:hypothetical protein